MADPLLGKKLGDYTVQELLGRGGMARVYKGFDERLQRYAAVKVISGDMILSDQAEYTERFRREARAIARLSHPNIVGVYQFGEYDGGYYMAMAFIEGRDLRQILKNYDEWSLDLPLSDIVNIVRGIGLALDYAHGRGVIHRDVKPSNIMLDAENHPVLTDFGLALDSNEGTLGDTFGSAHYIAPEQAISSAKAVPQSDIYSLGVCVYEMLTGRVPFDDPSAMAVALKHLNERPSSPRQLNPDLPVAIDAVMEKVLEKDPNKRYVNGQQFAQALEIALLSNVSPDAPLEVRGSSPDRPGSLLKKSGSQLKRIEARKGETRDDEWPDDYSSPSVPVGIAMIPANEDDNTATVVPPGFMDSLSRLTPRPPVKIESPVAVSNTVSKPEARRSSAVLIVGLIAVVLLGVGGVAAITGSNQPTATLTQILTIGTSEADDLTQTALAYAPSDSPTALPATDTPTLTATAVITDEPTQQVTEFVALPVTATRRGAPPTNTTRPTLTRTNTPDPTAQPTNAATIDPTSAAQGSGAETVTFTPPDFTAEPTSEVTSEASQEATPSVTEAVTETVATSVTAASLTPSDESKDIRLVYNGDQLSLTNISGRSVQIVELSFVLPINPERRFNASEWNTGGAVYSPRSFPANYCFQVSRSQFGAPKPTADCNSRLAAYRVVSNAKQFWVLPASASIDTFDVIYNGEVIAQCIVVDGQCEFNLPAN